MHYNPYFYPSSEHEEERQFPFPWSLLTPIFGPSTPPPGGGGFPGGGFPGGGFPGGGQQGPGSGGQFGAPSTPPPSFTPQQPQFQTFAVDPGAIRNCLFRFTYIWLRRDAFWFYPTFVGRTSIAGFRWNGFRWVYFGIDLNQIQSFQCF